MAPITIVGGSERRWPDRSSIERFTVSGVAGLLALAVWLADWRGGDWPGQIYRAGLFRRAGLTVWDAHWYGGHWTLTYSTLFPPLAGWIGVFPVGLVSVVASVWAYDRLVTEHFGRTARLSSYALAVALAAAIVIGQLTFLLGLAFGLLAGLAFARRHPVVAMGLALATALSSPVAAAFLVLVMFGFAWAQWPQQRASYGAVMAAAALPVGAMALLFPGQGRFPFRVQDFFGAFASSIFLLLFVLPRVERGLRRVTVAYAVVLVPCMVVRSPVGGNAIRLALYFAGPLVLAVGWPHRHKLLLASAIPLIASAWVPAIRSITIDGSGPSETKVYYQPVLRFLDEQTGPLGRVEVVPTKLHWEVVYVAPTELLARGWERQVDTAENPLFYGDEPLDAQTYLAWLRYNGVRWVALPDAPLDYAGEDEAALLKAGVPGLRLAATTGDWTMYEVEEAGLVSGPAQLVAMGNDSVELHSTGPGMVTVRVRNAAQWELVEGPACLAPNDGDWLVLAVSAPGTIRLDLDVTDADAGNCGE